MRMSVGGSFDADRSVFVIYAPRAPHAHYERFDNFDNHGIQNVMKQIVVTCTVKGVHSDGFITIVQPQAKAGATFQAL